MQRRDFRFEVKNVDKSGTGTFTGRASAAGNVDHHNDAVMAGAFAADLKASGTRRPLLWQHDPDNPIGFVDLEEDANGDLIAAGTLLLDVPQAKVAYTLLKAGAINGLSIGYEVTAESNAGSVRKLQGIKLWEVSVVTFPANTLARVTDVKARDEQDARQLVAAMQALALKMRLELLIQSIRSATRIEQTRQLTAAASRLDFRIALLGLDAQVSHLSRS